MPTRELGTVRKSLPLSDQDRKDLAVLRQSAAHREALEQLTGVQVVENLSDAALLHAVLEAGLRTVEHRVEAAGYAQIAADSKASRRRAVARRRRPTWADE